MASVVVCLDPGLLANPDTDLRYLLSDLLVDRSDGLLIDDGYDYLDDDRLLIFLRTEALIDAVPIVLKVVERERLLGNSLQSALVAVAHDGESEHIVIYPPSYEGGFAIA